MKKKLRYALCNKIIWGGLLLFSICNKASTQTLTNYAFTTSTGTFTALTTPTNPTITGTTDEGYFNNISIGFDFWYMGTRYTTVSASTNGWLTLGATISDAAYLNNLTSGTALRPVLAPLWDDLDIVAATNFSYKLTGSAGTRIFTVQYLNTKWSYTAAGAVSSFQVNFYESSGKIDFIYRSDATAANSPTASVGITATSTGSGSFLSVNNLGTTVSSTVEASVTTKRVSGKIYTFTPPIPTSPTSLSFTSVSSSSMTLNWTDNSSNETGFAIYQSTDGVNYSFISQTAAGAVSSVQAGLAESTTYYWKVYAVTEGGLSTALSGSQATPALVVGWYNSSWLYRKAITIDYTKVGTGPHTNIPVVVSTTDADLQAGALSTGYDILFTSADGTTKIAHEIETYTSGTGNLVTWVQVPGLSSSANTVIYMYYGNAAAANQQNVTGTWDASFKGVYHLNGVFTDATSNANNGANTGTIAATGKISNGRGYVRSDGADKITITGLMGSPANFTLSGWGTLTSRDNTGAHLVSIGDYSAINVDDITDGLLGSYYVSGNWGLTKSSPKLNPAGSGWHYFVYTFNDAGNAQALYMDGTLRGSEAYASSITFSGQGANTIIGGHANGSTNFDFDGTVDEVRIASSIRTAGWILTEYNNQNSPSTFYSVGTQESGVKTFTGTGNFSTAARWTGGTVPVAGDNIIIDGACTVDDNVGTDNVAYGTLTIGTATGRTLNWVASGTNRLNVSDVAAGAGASTLDMTNGGTLIVRGTLTSTSLSFTPGAGTIEIQSTMTLPAAFTTYYNLKVNGSGTTVTAGVNTTINNNLTLTSGTYTIGAFSLAVTGTVSVTGTMNISSATGAKSFGNLVINSGGTFTNTTANAPVTIAGNLQNDGTFSQGTGNVTFTGATSNTITGATATTAFGGGITVNKGVANTNILDVQCVITMVADGLRIINGTFKLSSNSTITVWTAEIATAPYNIPSTGGLWVNGGTISITSQISFAGLVRATAGTLNVGDADGERFYLKPGSGAIIVDGGIINVASRFSYTNASDVVSFTISSGSFNVGTVANSSAVSTFTILNAASSFTMSGGTITVVRSGSSWGYNNLAGTSTVTGGTIQIGNASTPAANTMSITSTPPLWNLTVNSTNAPIAQLLANLVVYNDVTISGGTLNTNSFDLTVGRNWANNGTFTSGTSTVTFNGTTTMSGTTLTNTFNNLTVAASSTVTSSTGLTGLVVNGTLNTGASAMLDLGTTTVLSGTLASISNSGTIKTFVITTTSATPIPAGKTWGGTIEYGTVNGGQTVVGGTFNNLTMDAAGGSGVYKTNTAAGDLVVNGTFTTISWGILNMGASYILSGTLAVITNGGNVRTAVPTSLSATPIPTGRTWGGTIDYSATNGLQTVVAGTFNWLSLQNTSGTNTAAGDLTISRFSTAAGGTLDMGSLYRIISLSSTLTHNGTVKTSVLTTTSASPFPAGRTWSGTGTVEYAATTGAQTVMSGTFNNLMLDNTSGTNTMSGNVTMNGIITLSGGTITTGSSYVISLNPGASLTRSTSGHVIGNLKKYLVTGATTATFEIGDATNYTPGTLSFANITTAQYLTASVTATEHPSLAGSGIRNDKSVNRYWSFINQGVIFTTATLTMNWVAGDLDAGATTGNFIVGQYNTPTWVLPSVVSPLSTSIDATGLTTLTEFAVGEACTLSSGFSYAGSPYCVNGGTASPTLTGTAGAFTSTAGLSINSVSGAVNLAASTAATYTVTNTATSAGCTSASTASITITAIIAGNSIDYTNGTHGTLCITPTENATGVLTAPLGNLFITVDFASYGTPTGSCLAFAASSCTASTSQSVTEGYVLGNRIASIPATNAVFTDPCNGSTKRLYVQATYTQPVCSGTSPGTLTGTTPTGGSGIYTYLWEQSTTSSSAGFAAAPGTNNAKDYAAGTLSQTTWYRRTVTSGSCTNNVSAVMRVTVVTAGTWTGAISTAWNTGGNWLCGTVPTTSTNATLPAGLSNYPIVSGSNAVNNISIASGATLAVTGTLQIAGTVTNAGTFDGSAGSINMNGSSLQVIAANTFAGNTLLNLLINNNVTLSGQDTITGTLTIGTTNITFATGGFLNLKSTASSTAMIAPLPVNGSGAATSFITGNVTVERFISNKRGWRLLTSPLSTTGSIYNSWQNGGIYEAGKGMFITGPNPGSTTGLDASTQNSISLKTYNAATQAYLNITNTKTSNLSNSTGTADNIGYFAFVRGDRNPNNLNAAYSSSTTLRSTGILQTGKQVFSASSTYNSFTIMGNPYASPIDFNNVGRTHLVKRFYAWDAASSQLGAYVTLDDINGDGIFSSSDPTSLLNNNIQSGQAFFVQTDTAGTASLTVYESSKSALRSNASFRPQEQIKSMGITLNVVAADNSIAKQDAVLAEFSPGYNAGVDLQDAVKFTNTNETLSFLRDGVSLAIERRHLMDFNDTLFLKLIQSSQKNYQFSVMALNMDQPNLLAFLEDKYLAIQTPISLSGNTIIDFTINADPASIKSDRFQVVFSREMVLPVTYTDVKAWQQGKNVAVQWTVENQLNILRYEVERSTDGVRFIKFNSNAIAANNTTSAVYNWVDTQAVRGTNFYRIRNIDRNAAFAYSKVVKVMVADAAGEIVVYPNPVTEHGSIGLQFNNMATGKYGIRLLNPIGQVVLMKHVSHAGGSATEKIMLSNYLAKGIYKLEITGQGKDKVFVTVIIQ